MLTAEEYMEHPNAEVCVNRAVECREGPEGGYMST